MITEVDHILFGKIIYTGARVTSVEHPNLKERLNWLMAPEQSHLFSGYYPNKFYYAVTELAGIRDGITKTENFGRENLPPGAVW
jgi:hypothetical protein